MDMTSSFKVELKFRTFLPHQKNYPSIHRIALRKKANYKHFLKFKINLNVVFFIRKFSITCLDSLFFQLSLICCSTEIRKTKQEFSWLKLMEIVEECDLEINYQRGYAQSFLGSISKIIDLAYF